MKMNRVIEQLSVAFESNLNPAIMQKKTQQSQNNTGDTAIRPGQPAPATQNLFKIPVSLLTEKAFADTAKGKIPNFQRLCRNLLETIDPTKDSFSALQFLDALQQSFSDHDAIQSLLEHQETRHVIIHNELMKVILIRWNPGESSNLHGHAEGGCVVKVLHGTVEESRYETGNPDRLLSRNTYFPGNLAYIDDRMGFHIVSNPESEPAITMHLYTPGNYKAKKA